MVRASFVDKHGVKKGAWSREEDDKLRAYIQRYGHWNWRELPKFAGLSRCGKSCRLRWMNYLRPDVKHGNYSKEEEDLIITLHEQLGNKWSMIAAKLQGRSDNEVKNHWHTHLKKRVKQKHNTSSELKEQSCVTSQSEISHSREQEADSELACTPTHPILESTPLSPKISSSENFSYLSSDSSVSGTSWIAEDSLMTSFETLEDSIGDFWTQPFVADNAYDQDCYALSLENEGYYDDNIDLFYQVMQELQGN